MNIPELIYIPDGLFIMGGICELDRNVFEDETPIHSLFMAGYYIAKTPTTNQMYYEYVVDAGAKPPSNWNNSQPSTRILDHPVVHVSWKEASEYCIWLSGKIGKNSRLPSEAEWEKAARGQHALLYPWGNEWNSELCNTRESLSEGTTSVDRFINGASPYTVLDMSGNVSEWTSSLWGEGRYPTYKYPYNPEDGRENLDEDDRIYRVVRGGSFLKSASYARCSARDKSSPLSRKVDLGFRIVADII